jgi:hypothetical protein
MDAIAKEIVCVNERPIPKDTIVFFQNKQGPRVFVSITDDSSVWKKDLAITERFFSEMVVCPFLTLPETVDKEIETVKEILKLRAKYPGVKDDPDALMVSKTWVLPNKISLGPGANQFLQPNPNLGLQKNCQHTIHDTFKPVFERLKSEEMIHILKLELTDGLERGLVYQFMDSGFRPSLIMIKWSSDLDDHIPTAHCAGHLLNSGYALVSLQNGYALYMYTDESLYDICSMKTVGLQNPIFLELTNTFNESLKNIQQSPRPLQ